jgi:hypothetical protein
MHFVLYILHCRMLRFNQIHDDIFVLQKKLGSNYKIVRENNNINK